MGASVSVDSSSYQMSNLHHGIGLDNYFNTIFYSQHLFFTFSTVYHLDDCKCKHHTITQWG